ncbi:MAG: glycerophosphodiester phosphodiesterase family protein [Acetobacterales bacterium]
MFRRLVALLMALLPVSAAAQTAPVVIAHRGASGLAPENTLAAFRKAIGAGADGMEFDVHLSADGHVVVHHDFTLKPEIARLDGEWLAAEGPALRTLTLVELRRYDVGRLRPGTAYARRYPDQQPADGARIPTLDEVLALVRDTAPADFQLWIELKLDPTKPAVSSDPDTLADAVVSAVQGAGMEARSTAISFHWPALYRIQRMAPGIRTGYLSAQRDWLDNIRTGQPGPSPWTAPLDVDDHGSIPRAIHAAGGAAWSVYIGDLTPAALREARALGLQVGVWTVRRKDEAALARSLVPDVVTTDRPDWYR